VVNFCAEENVPLIGLAGKDFGEIYRAVRWSLGQLR
jgi:hypothetical protein